MYILGSLVLFYAVASCTNADGIISLSRPQTSEAFTHSASIDEFDRFHLYWKFDEDDITFEIHAKTLGWVGLGFSPNGGMLGADIFMAWVKDGKAYGQDRFAEVDKSQPVIDKHQDWTLLMGKEELGYTVIKVKRKRITCDEQDFKITEDTSRMIYAWNDADPVDENSPIYHGVSQRGSRSMYLIEYGVLNANKGPEKLYTWELRVDNVTIPAEDTVYWCTLAEVPQKAKKMHVTRVAGLINKNNTGVVHHIVLYLCERKNLTGMVYDDRCRQDDMPVDLRTCRATMFGWAVGMQDFSYPDGVAFPLGADDEHFLMMEMHYDNPKKLSRRKISTRHIRNGKELAEISRDDHYDFDFQQQRVPKKPVVILPGDELITTCVYDSRERTNVTYSGEGTNDEMCLNFMSYYPRSQFKTCLSLSQDYAPMLNYVMEKAMTGEIHIDPEEHKQNNRTIYHYLNDINWTEDEVAKFQKLTIGTQRYREFCSRDEKGSMWGGAHSHRYRLVVDEPYKEQDICEPIVKESKSSFLSTNKLMVVLATVLSLFKL